MTWIKLCGLVQPDDFRLAVELGVDAIGVVAVPDTLRCISLDDAQILGDINRDTSLLAMVTQDGAEAWIKAYISACRPDLLQFHGHETPQFCASFGLPYIKVARSLDQAELVSLAAHGEARYWMLDLKTEIAEIPGMVAELPVPWILAGGLNVQNVADQIRRLQPFGVDVSRGIEELPRKKNRDKMRAFVHAIRDAAGN